MPIPSYSDGTISIANGSTSLVLNGGAWSTQVKPGDIILHVPAAAAQSVVGFALTVDDDLNITLADAYNGTTLSGEPYRIVRGINWLSGATPGEILIEFLTRLKDLGLAGSGSGAPEIGIGENNELYVDTASRLLYQRRAGQWHVVEVVAQTFYPAGPWVGNPTTKTALAISTGNVAVDFDTGAVDPDGRMHFALTFDDDFALQLPTNVEVGEVYDILFTADGGPHTPSFASGFIGVPASSIRTADGASTRMRFTVDAETAGTATAVSVALVTFGLNNFVDYGGFNYLSNIDSNSAEPSASESNWTWVPQGVIDAVNLSFTPAGNIAATNVQAAIEELDTEKIPLTYIDTDVALTADSDTKLASQKAVKAYVDQILSAQDAMVFQGVLDCSTNPNYPAADAGHVYSVSVAGKVGGASGVNVEIGDRLLCLVDSTASGDQATVGANWHINQANIDGAVVGPVSAIDSHFAQFDGTSGKLIKGGIALDTDDTLAADSDTRIPSQQAVKKYAASPGRAYALSILFGG